MIQHSVYDSHYDDGADRARDFIAQWEDASQGVLMKSVMAMCSRGLSIRPDRLLCGAMRFATGSMGYPAYRMIRAAWAASLGTHCGDLFSPDSRRRLTPLEFLFCKVLDVRLDWTPIGDRA